MAIAGSVVAGRVVIVGCGKIGSAIVKLLHASGRFKLKVVEQHAPLLETVAHLRNVETASFAVQDPEKLRAAIEGWDAVVSACSYDVNPLIAKACADAGCSYFDLTEDVETTRRIRELATVAKPGQIFMPQCGLAPGFIGILAWDICRHFDKLDSVKMRVGALPKYPTNRMMYNLTWSTDGLINEYCNACEAIQDHQLMDLVALEGLEQISLDGVVYEAFNTSGGLGTLCESLQGKVRELNYKTVRYRGHQYLMQFLIRELQLGEQHKRAMLKSILEEAVPMTRQDVVLTFASVQGWRNGQFEQITDARKIYHKKLHGESWSSIQLTTASSLCAVVDLYFAGRIPQQGFVRQEDVRLADFLATEFGEVYKTAEPITHA